MLCAPPLLPPYHHRQLGVPSLSVSSSLRAADASKDAMADEEGGVANNVFASLMPNLFNRLNHCDDTVSEQEFQEIHRLLNARSEDDLVERNTSISQPSDKNTQEEVKNIQDDEKAQEGLEKNPSSFTKSDHGGGKENASPKNAPQRTKLSRRERSSRVTTHRKPFVVDIRSFGSILNNNVLGKCQKPQDVHAFWEAADEREASKAIMDKLRGRCEQQAVSGTKSLRRVGVRRKNSQRMTTRLKRFAVELPSCAEQVQSLDQERLEEEEDATEESSFTFLSNPEFRILNQTLEQKDEMKKIKGSQLSSPSNIIKKSMKISYLDEVRDQPEEDLDILSDGKSPALYVTETVNGQPFAGVRDATGEVPACNKQSQASELVDVLQTENAEDFVNSPASIIHDTVLVENHDAAGIFEMKATPYNRNLASKRTPFTSPTPPSNPLAVFGLTKETVAEDMSKRRLDFDDTMDLPALDMELPAPVTQNTPSLQTFLSPCNKLAEDESLGSAKVLTAEPVPPAAPLSSEALNSFQQIAAKLPKPITKRKKPVDNRRNSLAGAGTSWEEGHRRSTRIKSRPLEWWRGERFLRGRVHKSLATVIGIKYSSPPPCWPKRGSRAPKFKVESYVPDEYAKFVQFAALG